MIFAFCRAGVTKTTTSKVQGATEIREAEGRAGDAVANQGARDLGHRPELKVTHMLRVTKAHQPSKFGFLCEIH